MSINILPNELLEKIFIYFIPGIDCDLCEFRKYFFLDMRWTSILLSFSFRCKYAKKLGIYKFYKKKYDSAFILSSLFSYENLLGITCYNEIFMRFSPELIDIIGYDNLINLPICKFKSSRCINNMCSHRCYKHNHVLGRYVYDRESNLMRGVDDLNRTYLLFIYKDTTTDKLYYEFIYHETLGNEKFVTYSGKLNNTFIGMLSDNRLFTDPIFNRELQLRSYNYIKRLVNNEHCGIVTYAPESDNFYESNDGNITLYY